MVASKQGSSIRVGNGCFLTRNENYEVATVQFFTAKYTAFHCSSSPAAMAASKSFRSTSLIVGVSQLKLQNLSKK